MHFFWHWSNKETSLQYQYLFFLKQPNITVQSKGSEQVAASLNWYFFLLLYIAALPCVAALQDTCRRVSAYAVAEDQQVSPSEMGRKGHEGKRASKLPRQSVLLAQVCSYLPRKQWMNGLL